MKEIQTCAKGVASSEEAHALVERQAHAWRWADKRVLLEGDQGAAEWTWSETDRADGGRHTVEDAIIFELREDKLVSRREYFDTAALRPTHSN